MSWQNLIRLVISAPSTFFVPLLLAREQVLLLFLQDINIVSSPHRNTFLRVRDRDTYNYLEDLLTLSIHTGLPMSRDGFEVERQFALDALQESEKFTALNRQFQVVRAAEILLPYVDRLPDSMFLHCISCLIS